jgi:hypothetical protein
MQTWRAKRANPRASCVAHVHVPQIGTGAELDGERRLRETRARAFRMWAGY